MNAESLAAGYLVAILRSDARDGMRLNECLMCRPRTRYGLAVCTACAERELLRRGVDAMRIRDLYAMVEREAEMAGRIDDAEADIIAAASAEGER